MKTQWQPVSTTESLGLKGDMNITTYFATIGKVRLQINTKNLKLSAQIKSQLTFLGLNHGNSPFESIEKAMEWVEERRAQIEKCKTMSKLIYVN